MKATAPSSTWLKTNQELSSSRSNSKDLVLDNDMDMLDMDTDMTGYTGQNGLETMDVSDTVEKRPKRALTQKPSESKALQDNTTKSSYKTRSSLGTAGEMDISFETSDLTKPWLSMNIEELRQSYTKLHSRHHKLRELRETEAEKLLQRYKKSMEAEMTAMSDQLKLLQEENQHLQQLKEELKSAKEREQDYIDQLEQLQSSELLELYSKLTGAVITRQTTEDPRDIVFDFVHEGRNGVIQYRLIFSLEDEDIEFMPTMDAESDPEMWSRLPEFMREPLLFNQEELSMFFWRVSNHLNHQHKSKRPVV
ncbi:hypothetical protein BDF19DRAFT_440115 [Syncephalis fuscata]|nr:hypothetical protein BDF19DRAFT_440115 [Syncephalis fuscata]